MAMLVLIWFGIAAVVAVLGYLIFRWRLRTLRAEEENRQEENEE